MNISISIKTQNVRSFNLSDKNDYKTKAKIEACLSEMDDIILLTNVQIGSNINKITRKFNDKGYELFCNSKSNTGAGVAIALRIAKDMKILNIDKDEDDRILVIKLMIDEEIITVVAFYDTNLNTSLFLEKIDNILEHGNITDGYIIGGDINVILDKDKDQKGFGDKHHHRTNAKRYIDLNIENGTYKDIYRSLNKVGKAITYVPDTVNDRLKPAKGRRLDMFLTSPEFVNSSSKILHKSDQHYTDNHNMAKAKFDHGSVRLLINKEKADIGPGQFKLDPFLLTSGQLDNLINQIIYEAQIYTTECPEITKAYEDRNAKVAPLLSELIAIENSKGSNNNNNTIDEAELNILNDLAAIDKKLPTLKQLEIINKDVADKVLTTIQNGILTKVMMEQNNLAKQRKNELKNIIENVHKANLNLRNATEETLISANEEKVKFEAAYEEYFRRKMANSKIFRDINSEKPTKHFFNQWSDKQSMDSPSTKLKKDGHHYESKEEAREELKNHFANIFKSHEEQKTNSIEEFLGDLKNCNEVLSRKLTADEKSNLEKDVTEEELLEVLKSTEKGKTPGQDGIEKIFLTRFWDKMGRIITDSINIFISRKELNAFLDRGIIKVIKKAGTSGEEFKNWRPITLLSQIYKIFSGTVALRLKPLLGKLISGCQKAYTNAANIGEIVIDIIEQIAISKFEKNPGIILLVDFSRAFDSISHSYIYETFSFLNFGNNFINIIRTMLTKRCCNLMVDGYLTSSFKIERGVPQGDTASPYIFIIVLEILLLRLKNDPGILKLNILPHDNPEDNNDVNIDPLAVFADDMTILMKETEDNLIRVRDIFKDFAKVSGLEINEDKTVIIRIGTRLDDLTPITDKVRFKYTTSFKLLGFTIDNKLETLNNNFVSKEAKINKLIAMWRKYNFSTIGNLIVSKTYLISQLSYVMSVLECPPTILARMQKNIDTFILKSSSPWISKERLYIDPSKGGLGAINLTDFSISLKMSWAKRAINSKGLWAQILRKKVQKDTNICLIRSSNISEKHVGLLSIVKAFEITSDIHMKATKDSKPVISKTTLDMLNCVRKKGPRGSFVLTRPTKGSHPELFRPGRICEITPIDLCDRLNLELGVVKIKTNELIHELLETKNLDPVSKTMIILRTKKLVDCIKDKIVIERRDSNPNLVDTVIATKKGSKPFRKLLHVGDKIKTRTWENINNTYDISSKPGNEHYFSRSYKFWRNKYLNLEQQRFHLYNINNRLRYNLQLSKYVKNEDGSKYDDKCTTCKLARIINPPRESSTHLYIECFKAKEILSHIKETFKIKDPVDTEEIIFFSNHTDGWERLKRNIVFLDFKIYLNRCRRANILPTKESAVLAIQRTLLMVFKTNPSDNNLIDGLLPLITGKGITNDQAEQILFRANTNPDISKILFESQRRNIFLSTKTSSNLILNNAQIGCVAKRIQSNFDAASCAHH